MSCQSDFNTARTFSARNRLGLPHDLRMVDSPMNEVNKLSSNLMKLAFMLGTNTEGSPISHLEETSLLENITRMNFLFDNVRGRQMQQLPNRLVARIGNIPPAVNIPQAVNFQQALPQVPPMDLTGLEYPHEPYTQPQDGGSRRRRSRKKSRKRSKKKCKCKDKSKCK